MVPQMRLKRDGAVGNSACVNGRRPAARKIVEIHEMATVGWPPRRKHCGRLFPRSPLQVEQGSASSGNISLRRRNMKIRSELYCTLQFLAKKQNAICLRTVRVGIQILVAFRVVLEVITPDLRRALILRPPFLHNPLCRAPCRVVAVRTVWITGIGPRKKCEFEAAKSSRV